MPKRRIAIAALIAAALAGGGWLWLPLDGNGDALTLYGHIELRDAELAFNEQGPVTEVLVEEGAAVKQDQVLARLDRRRLSTRLDEARAMLAAQEQTLRRLTSGTRPQQIEQSEAELAAARARLALAEQRVRRVEQTLERGASTEQDLDNAVAERDVARAELNVRRKALELAREGFREEAIAEARSVLDARRANVAHLQARLDDTELRAPEAGVIQSRLVEPGETAAPARAAFVLARTEPKWVRAYLPEPELGHVRRDMAARVYSDSFDNRHFDGTVGFISPSAEFTPKNVQTEELRTRLVYETRIRVKDPDNELRLGMPVTVVIDTDPRGQ